jgi:hypothetical protein
MRSHWKAAVCAGVLALGFPPHGAAQGSEGEYNGVATVTGVKVSLVGLSTTLGIHALVRQPRRPNEVPDDKQTARLAHEYLCLRLHQFREDVALGAGPTVEELAEVVKLRQEHVPHFGKLLRSHRGELLTLADARTLTPERSLSLLRRVGALMLGDPLLRGDVETALVAQGAR